MLIMALSLFVVWALALLLGFISYFLYGLQVNYSAARKTGLTIIVLPFDCGNPLWMIMDRKVVHLFRRIPYCSGSFTRFN